MNSTPKGERIHIGIFGKRNAGKSSILNAITNQKLAITSEIAGTTTDPVYKAMELLPLGPVVFIDTPGLDDIGELGKQRVNKAYEALNKTNLALLIIDSTVGMTEEDLCIETKIKEKKIPYLCIYNKCDLLTTDTMTQMTTSESTEESRLSESCTSDVLSNNICNKITKNNTDKLNNIIYVSASTNQNITLLKNTIAAIGNELLTESTPPIVKDLVSQGDVVILVVPIDKAAPKGRLILPQQQTIRELLDTGAHTMIVRDSELADTFHKLSCKPKLVITDSQAFKGVAKIVPRDILLTSFSILMSRHKGNFTDALNGVKALNAITDQSHILISEGCSHHRQCGDIGTVKLPNLIRNFTNSNPAFTFTSGAEFPNELTKYDLIIHCGGCMLNEREMKYRYSQAILNHIPITNYGLALSYMNHILDRSIEILK